MKKAALIVLLLIVGVSAIAKHHKNKKKQKAGTDIIAVSMRRTGCYGRCPSYIIELTQSGMVKYTAIRFTTDSGIFRKNIGLIRTTEILDQVINTRVDT